MSIPSKLVAITGASGFLGSEIALEALRQGYRVRLVVRKQTQADAFREKYSEFAAKVESVVVADIEAEGGLDEAVKGSDAFIHSASPVSDGSYSARDVLDPAINGTLAALRSASNEPKLKTFVLTTSVVAHLDPANIPPPGTELTDKDWPSMTYETAAKLPKESGGLIYCASKQLAEKAAWQFVREKKPSFTLTTIAPTWVTGYNSEATLKTWKDLRSTPGMTKKAIFDVKEYGPPSTSQHYVDVLNVAQAHVGAVRLGQEVAGRRFLVSGGRFSYPEAARLVAKAVPEFASRFPHTDGAPFAPLFNIDGSPAAKTFGFEYITLEKSMERFAKQLAALPL